MQFTDAATLSGTRKTSDGFLVADAFAVRTGIQLYAGKEVGLVDRDVVRVWRPEAEVKDAKSLATFSHAPVTLGHPTEMVTADNWAALAKGEVSTEATWDGNKIRLPLIVKDAAAIAAIESGTRELSAGYTCQLDFTDGVTPDGEAYDAIQRGIRINHLAIVTKGRAGSDCRIGDGADTWGASPVSTADMKGSHMADTLQTVVLGDQAAQVAVADAPKIEAFKAASAKALSDAQADHAKAIAAKDAELAKLQAKLDDATGKVLTDAALDARVQARADLIGKAKMIAKDVATTGLSDAAIRKAAVVAALGDAAIAGKSEAYIDARFDILAEDAAKGDPVAKALADVTKGTDRASVYKKRDQDLANAWRGNSKKEAV